MRRTYLFLGLILATTATAGFVWRSKANQAPPKVAVTPPDEPVETAQPRPLPLTQVVLFSSGVAYFQREGTVDGDVRVDLTFPVGDVNDLLKSLVFHDLGGGKIRAVSYDGQEPVDKTLKAFALDLTMNPTLGQLLNQARGEKVEVALQNAGNQPANLSGVIMGMEQQQQPDAKDKMHEVDVLNLVCAEGVRAVPLSQVSRFRFLNPTLDAEFRKALDVLAATHNTQKRTVSLHFTGEGKRSVKLGYVLENPIWKTSYRLMLEKGKAALQGFAVVENTTDEDWKDVRLVLVSGRPISFQMDLYQPLFLPRPTVEPERFASLRPPVFQGDLAGGQFGGGQFGQLGQLGQLGGQLGQFGQLGQLGQIGCHGMGVMPSLPAQQQMNGRYQMQNGLLNQPEPRVRLSFEEMQRRRQEQKAHEAEAAKVGEAVAAADSSAIDAAFEAQGAAEQYKYLIEQKLTLPRQKSALLPVVTHAVDAERVSIYNPFVNVRFPLLGVRFRNTTGLHLAQGPVTVFDGGEYAGDARLPDLSPDELRPLGYAVDLAMEVKITDDWTIGPKVTLDPRDAKNLNVEFDKRHTRKYLIRNRSKEDRHVLVDHPIREHLQLLDNNKPIETTRSRYRFLVEAPADKTTTFAVAEEEHSTATAPFAVNTGEKGEHIHHASALNIRLEIIRREPTSELVNVKIDKGVIVVSTRLVQETAYRVNHGTGQNLQVSLLHNTQPGRSVDGGKKLGENSTLYRFEFEVPGRIGEQLVTERWIVARRDLNSTEEELAQLQASQVVAPKVKAALGTILERQTARNRVMEEAVELKQKRTAITEEQTRLRANIDKVPRESAAFKRYLEKFDTQETELEKLHTAIEAKQAEEKRLQREFNLFMKGLSVE